MSSSIKIPMGMPLSTIRLSESVCDSAQPAVPALRAAGSDSVELWLNAAFTTIDSSTGCAKTALPLTPGTRHAEPNPRFDVADINADIWFSLSFELARFVRKIGTVLQSGPLAAGAVSAAWRSSRAAFCRGCSWLSELRPGSSVIRAANVGADAAILLAASLARVAGLRARIGFS